MKIKYIILFILALLVGGGLLLYHNTFGFGAKKKYENCVRACEKTLLLKSNIPACKPRCEEITGYSPTKKTSSPTK